METSDLARRKLWTNVVHAIDLVVLGGLAVLVFAFEKPGWLILLALPTLFLALYLQHRLLAAEAAAGAAG